MRRKRFVSSTFVFVCLLSACGSGSTTLRYFRETGGLERASFDLDCPKEQLNVVSLSEVGLQAGVKGCGQKAVYVYINGAWLLNSEIPKRKSGDTDKEAP